MIITSVIIPFCYLLAFNPIFYVCIILGALLYAVYMCIFHYFYPKQVYRLAYIFYRSKPGRPFRVGFVRYLPGGFIRDYSTSTGNNELLNDEAPNNPDMPRE